MKKILISTAAALLLTGACTGFADELKVGVIDLRTILDKSPQVKKMTEDLKKQFGPQEEKIKKLDQTIQDDIKKLQRDNAVMSDSDRKKLQEKIVKERQDIQQMSMQFQQNAAAEQAKATQKVFDEIRAIIKQVAEKNKLNLVIQKDVVYYNDANLDVTDQVVKSL